MVYASSHQGYSNSASYGNGGAGGTATSLYVIKMNPVCCGSFSRGQRCGGCPGR
ncbi:MAG: hypothetical protein AABX13_02370 [Nanoarchaeota archaeon]